MFLFEKKTNCLYSKDHNREQLSLQFCIRMASQIDKLRSIAEKKSALLCCRGRKGIEYLFLWLLQNNLLYLLYFEMWLASGNAFAFLFQTLFPPRRLFCNKYENACFIS